MIYKNILFCALLVPFSIFSDGNIESNNAIEQRIQKLNTERSEMLLRISDLGKNIAEKDEYIQSLQASAIDFFVKVLKKKGFKDAQEIKEFGLVIDAELVNFKKAFDETILLKKNVKGFLVNELFKSNTNEPMEDFETLKFCVIRMITEYKILKIFIKGYEELHQELIEIDQKLDDLKRTSNN